MTGINFGLFGLGLLRLTCASLCALPLQAFAQESDSIAQVLGVGRQMMTRIVKVYARDADGRLNVGSGVPIAEQLIATNCHVTRRAESIGLIVNGPQGLQRRTVLSQASAPAQDVCVLKVTESLPLPPIPLGSPPEIGQAVVAVGFTGGFGPRMHPGLVQALHLYQGAHVIQSSTAFNSGASGGALLTERGELVGLLTFRSGFGERRFFSAPAAWIEAIVNTQPFEPVAPQLPVRAYWEHSPEELPQFLQRNFTAPTPATRLGQSSLGLGSGASPSR